MTGPRLPNYRRVMKCAIRIRIRNVVFSPLCVFCSYFIHCMTILYDNSQYTGMTVQVFEMIAVSDELDVEEGWLLRVLDIPRRGFLSFSQSLMRLGR